jgi:hypothetical protein
VLRVRADLQVAFALKSIEQFSIIGIARAKTPAKH